VTATMLIAPLEDRSQMFIALATLRGFVMAPGTPPPIAEAMLSQIDLICLIAFGEELLGEFKRLAEYAVDELREDGQ